MRIDDVVKIISKTIAPLKRKVLLSIAHGIIEATQDDGGIQLVKATYMADETKNDVRKMHHFGFSSNAPAGSDAIAVSVAGNREASVIIATENREFRFKGLAEGDAVFYNKNGKLIHLKGDNIEALCSKIKIENDSHELITVLIEWMDEVLTSKNLTGIGPQPMTPDSIAALTAVKEKLETFKA